MIDEAVLADRAGALDHAVTLCVHVHNRLRQLALTLPANLDAVRATPGTGLVVLDYNSSDGVADWIRERYLGDIAAGRLLFAREATARHFHASRSKNLAHRLGGGRLLINLDGDNLVGHTLPFLRSVADASPRMVVHMWSGTWRDGTYGRIGVSRALFHAIGGYDESLLPIGHQDTDLVSRARAAGGDFIATRGDGFTATSGLRVEALPNSKDESLRFTGTSMSFDVMNRLNIWKASWNRLRRGTRANPGGWGRGVVEVNFADEVRLT